ncbi:hypothetical protein CERZMDRAFT_81126 [Cercospora zeae-maydis SCOH1-5]|uniref:F-box domain-containing protein n=1 Tax=Cercospora zeae-maydis SCOH1-5 TaxID=717836 RepID=A0A6A6FUR8_9PEZI|nr:hypothetical protein CERZMDRAFT_81126 [Cercospora zeae-maydis SCOH1-5]
MEKQRPEKGLRVITHNLPDPFTTEETRNALIVRNHIAIFGNAGAWHPPQNTFALPLAPPPAPLISPPSHSKNAAHAPSEPGPSRRSFRLYLSEILLSQPATYPQSRFRQYLSTRLNVRLFTDPIKEFHYQIFPGNVSAGRTGGFLGIRILAHLDMKTLLLAQRVNRHFNTLIRQSAHLQRRLWFQDCSDPLFPDLQHIDPPWFIDPLIVFIRTELHFFYNYDPENEIQSLLYAPTRGKYALPNVLETSWRKMLVMRSAEKGKFWRVVISGYGHVNMGVFEIAPTFGQVLDAIVDVLRFGGRRYQVLSAN